MIQFVVPILILIIIAVQAYFYTQNLKRMHEFRDIFKDKESWSLTHDPDTNFVNGIEGSGNNIFFDIKKSINKYLRNNAGSVIDFGLLKDAVDRHCDSVEDDISTQMPVPLYCGLAGTMLGVIIGLSSLLITGSITDLLGAAGGSGNTGAAAAGVNDLLTGVAWAMLASICGITLTTINSLKFKKCKLEEESGKNEFLAWMQSRLLPELPSDTSEALNRLVKNLNRFNETFKENTVNLGDKLQKVNESYDTQAEVIKMVHDMDVMKMAKANVKVLDSLQSCTDELEQFQQYLNSINGYTATIRRFTELFNSESDRLHVLEEIRDFFMRNKAEISKNISDEDAALKTALRNMTEDSVDNLEALKKALVDQTDNFKTTNRELLNTLTQQMNAFPKLNKNLDDISKIPSELENLTKKIQQSNDNVVRQVQLKLNSLQMQKGIDGGSNGGSTTMPKSMKALIWVVGIVVIVASLFISFMSFMSWRNTSNIQGAIESSEQSTQVVDSTSVNNISTKADSVSTKVPVKKDGVTQSPKPSYPTSKVSKGAVNVEYNVSSKGQQ